MAESRPFDGPLILKLTLVAGLLLTAGCAGSVPAAPGTTPSPTEAPTPSCNVSPIVSGTPELTTTLVARGLSRPLDLTAPRGDCRLFVVEQAGRIRILRDGTFATTPYLDIAARVRSTESERGLLGLAFHPRYAENGRFFVNYTDSAGDTHIAEFRAAPSSSDTADASSERLVLLVRQPYANHNGGGLAFGTDGYLYIALGDGGGSGDPQGNGQKLGTHLGKLLRIDVDGGSPYAVPPDNPFVARAGALPEIWAYGLRNPWRFAVDRVTGDLLIADVGQSRIEEIDLGLASRHGGENYGWNVTEGSACYQPSVDCDRTGQALPIYEYGHSEGCSISGGIVYRGRRMPGYHGTYFFGDYCRPFVRSLRVQDGRASDVREWTSSLGRGLNNVTSFGADGDGEPYIVDQDGEIYAIVPVG